MFVFFFKQKTAYEMRISDWSSDVCSSDLVLIAIPLFVFMGVVLQHSRIAEELLETMGRLFGSLRGGLGVSVILVGALLAASTGIVGATVVAMGMIALPTMLRNGYSPQLASGVVCTAGRSEEHPSELQSLM